MKREIEDGDEIQFEKRGKGTPLLLLHAFPLSGAMWRAQIDLFAKEYKVIAPNLRGIGETSPFADAPSIDQMADDIAALLNEMRLAEPIVLCGISMGGYVAMAFARRHPQRLRALVLCDTRAEADTVEEQGKRDEMIRFASTNSSSDVFAKMAPDILGETTRETKAALVQKIAELSSDHNPQALANLLRALRDRPDATPHLAKIKVPTLVLVGHEDTVAPPTAARTLAKQIPNAQLHLIPQAGHLSNLERPQEFNRLMLAFLREI